MNLYILISGFFSFFVCFLAHVLLWRLRRPKSDIFALVFIFIIIPFALFLSASLLHKITFIDLASIALLHIALSGAYIMSYPAVQAKCPSLNIMLIVNHSMPEGVTEKEIEQSLGKDILLDTMIEKMVEERFVKEDNAILIPTRLGKTLAGVFIIFRYILGAKQSRG